MTKVWIYGSKWEDYYLSTTYKYGKEVEVDPSFIARFDAAEKEWEALQEELYKLNNEASRPT